MDSKGSFNSLHGSIDSEGFFDGSSSGTGAGVGFFDGTCVGFFDGACVCFFDGAGVGFEGNVKAKYGVHYVINLPCQYQKKDRFGKGIKGYTLGAWWVETAVNGLWPKLPVVNVTAKLQCERKTKKKN